MMQTTMLHLLRWSLIVFAALLNAQTWEIEVIPAQKNDQTYWNIVGSTDMADKTTVSGRLLLDNAELPDSRFRATVRSNRCSFHYGPINGKVLSGTYCVELAVPSRFPTTVVIPKTFYIGTPYQERMERLRYRDFFHKAGDWLQKLPPELSRQRELWLHKERLTEAQQQELQRVAHKFMNERHNLQQEMAHYTSPQIFMPYSQANFDDLETLLAAAERLVCLEMGLILQYHNLPLPQDYQNPPPAEVQEYWQLLKNLEARRGQKKYNLSREWKDGLAKLNSLSSSYQRYEAELTELFQAIPQKVQAILDQEPVGERLNSLDLQNDLSWYQEKLRELQAKYQAARSQFQPEDWQQYQEVLGQDLAYWESKTSGYSRSPLATQDAKLPKFLPRLSDNLKILLAAYTKELREVPAGKKASPTPPGVSKIIQSITNDLQHLQMLAVQETEKNRELQKNLCKTIQENIAQFQTLYAELEELEAALEQGKAPDLTAVKKWHDLCKKLGQELQAQSKNTAGDQFFPGVISRQAVAVYNLLLAGQYCQQAGNLKQKLESFAKSRQHRYYAMQVILQLQEDLATSPK